MQKEFMSSLEGHNRINSFLFAHLLSKLMSNFWKLFGEIEHNCSKHLNVHWLVKAAVNFAIV